MSRLAWMEQPADLLRQRRLEQALPPEAAAITPARRPLLLGAISGGTALAVVLLAWLLLGLRLQQLEQQLEGLRTIPDQVQALEKQSQTLRRQISERQRSSEGLARGLVAVSSGSALLAQLGLITPQGVQLTDVSVQGDRLSLKGLAADPQAFRRINGLGLLLGQSPLVQPEEVRVVKLSRDSASGKESGAAPVAWELSAQFAKLPAARQLTVLQQLKAEGLARRLQVLERAGVLP